jgi:hypothetical protein
LKHPESAVGVLGSKTTEVEELQWVYNRIKAHRAWLPPTVNDMWRRIFGSAEAAALAAADNLAVARLMEQQQEQQQQQHTAAAAASVGGGAAGAGGSSSTIIERSYGSNLRERRGDEAISKAPSIALLMTGDDKVCYSTIQLSTSDNTIHDRCVCSCHATTDRTDDDDDNCSTTATTASNQLTVLT